MDLTVLGTNNRQQTLNTGDEENLLDCQPHVQDQNNSLLIDQKVRDYSDHSSLLPINNSTTNMCVRQYKQFSLFQHLPLPSICQVNTQLLAQEQTLDDEKQRQTKFDQWQNIPSLSYMSGSVKDSSAKLTENIELEVGEFKCAQKRSVCFEQLKDKINEMIQITSSNESPCLESIKKGSAEQSIENQRVKINLNKPDLKSDSQFPDFEFNYDENKMENINMQNNSIIINLYPCQEENLQCTNCSNFENKNDISSQHLNHTNDKSLAAPLVQILIQNNDLKHDKNPSNQDTHIMNLDQDQFISDPLGDKMEIQFVSSFQNTKNENIDVLIQKQSDNLINQVPLQQVINRNQEQQQNHIISSLDPLDTNHQMSCSLMLNDHSKNENGCELIMFENTDSNQQNYVEFGISENPQINVQPKNLIEDKMHILLEEMPSIDQIKQQNHRNTELQYQGHETNSFSSEPHVKNDRLPQNQKQEAIVYGIGQTTESYHSPITDLEEFVSINNQQSSIVPTIIQEIPAQVSADLKYDGTNLRETKKVLNNESTEQINKLEYFNGSELNNQIIQFNKPESMQTQRSQQINCGSVQDRSHVKQNSNSFILQQQVSRNQKVINNNINVQQSNSCLHIIDTPQSKKYNILQEVYTQKQKRNFSINSALQQTCLPVKNNQIPISFPIINVGSNQDFGIQHKDQRQGQSCINITINRYNEVKLSIFNPTNQLQTVPFRQKQSIGQTMQKRYSMDIGQQKDISTDDRSIQCESILDKSHSKYKFKEKQTNEIEFLQGDDEVEKKIEQFVNDYLSCDELKESNHKQFEKLLMPFVVIKFTPEPKNQMGARLLTNGLILVGLVKLITRSNASQFLMNYIYDYMRSSFVISNDSYLFKQEASKARQRYQEYLQKQFNQFYFKKRNSDQKNNEQKKEELIKRRPVEQQFHSISGCEKNHNIQQTSPRLLSIVPRSVHYNEKVEKVLANQFVSAQKSVRQMDQTSLNKAENLSKIKQNIKNLQILKSREREEERSKQQLALRLTEKVFKEDEKRKIQENLQSERKQKSQMEEKQKKQSSLLRAPQREEEKVINIYELHEKYKKIRQSDNKEKTQEKPTYEYQSILKSNNNDVDDSELKRKRKSLMEEDSEDLSGKFREEKKARRQVQFAPSDIYFEQNKILTPVDREEIDDEAKKKRKKSQRNKSKPKEKDSSVDESEDDKTLLGLRKSRKNSKR